ncbi:unnamed protein product [Prunus brigantina]
MSRKVEAIISLLLMAACAATGLAHVPPPPALPLFPPIPGLLPPGIPGLPPPGNPDDIAKCWSSLQNVPGCAWEIYTSISTGKFVVGPACCKAFQAIDQNCLLKMFPFFPSFPPLINSNCASSAAPKAGGMKLPKWHRCHPQVRASGLSASSLFLSFCCFLFAFSWLLRLLPHVWKHSQRGPDSARGRRENYLDNADATIFII